MMDDELREGLGLRPFCGKGTVAPFVDGNRDAYVLCACGGAGPVVKMDKDESRYDEVVSESVVLWRTRPVEDALRAENAALKALWEGVPWEAIRSCTRSAMVGDMDGKAAMTVVYWIASIKLEGEVTNAE